MRHALASFQSPTAQRWQSSASANSTLVEMTNLTVAASVICGSRWKRRPVTRGLPADGLAYPARNRARKAKAPLVPGSQMASA
jgi:hypothetical protein